MILHFLGWGTTQTLLALGAALSVGISFLINAINDKKVAKRRFRGVGALALTSVLFAVTSLAFSALVAYTLMF